ncbi:hypothetical protein C8R43DRAFT_211457 [Mycena crocata]|nr:hypothetical protein C8R43DRAFT_211457 [Mycena crocata]
MMCFARPSKMWILFSNLLTAGTWNLSAQLGTIRPSFNILPASIASADSVSDHTHHGMFHRFEAVIRQELLYETQNNRSQRSLE